MPASQAPSDVPALPVADADVPRFLADLGVTGDRLLGRSGWTGSRSTPLDGRGRPSGGSGMIRRAPGVILVLSPFRRRKGVNGFDSGCRSRGSVPRKTTMISLTMRRKKISATYKGTARSDLALAA